MKSILNYTPAHILVWYAAGILFQFTYKADLPLPLLFGLVLFFLGCIQWIRFHYFLFGVAVFLIGILGVQIKTTPENGALQQQSDSKEIVFSISNVLKETNYYNRYEGTVLQVASKSAKGKISVRIEKDSLRKKLPIGAVVLANSPIDTLNSALNPYAFDYKSYLKKNNISEQVLVKKGAWKRLPQPVFSIRKIAFEYREKWIHALEKEIENKQVLAITLALLLGERDHISNELQQNYVNAGVVHILAVSGLHIGMLVMFLHFILKPLKRFTYGSLFIFIGSVFFLWGYAFVAGLSASVVRAVTMFSFVSLGIVLKNKTNVFYSLISSALLLLLCNPFFLFSLGFQLSYIAVISIVVVQPMLNRLWKPSYKIVKYFWDLSTVSLAAQIGVLPLSLYYFHQFPGLFLLSNLVIIPCLGLVLVLGFFVLLLTMSRFQFSLLTDVYSGLVQAMNYFISFVSEQEKWLFKEVHFSGVQMLAFYVLLLFGTLFLKKRTLRSVYLFLGAVLLVQLVFMYELNKKKNRNEFIVYQQYKSSLITVAGQGCIRSYGVRNTYAKKLLQQYATGVGMPVTVEKEKAPSLYRFEETLILVIDSLGVYQLPECKHQILLLQNSPKINLERCIQYMQPKLIVVDASNYPYKKEKWKATCEKMKVPFYDTSVSGAFVLTAQESSEVFRFPNFHMNTPLERNIKRE